MHDIVIGMPDDPPPSEIVVTELASQITARRSDLAAFSPASPILAGR